MSMITGYATRMPGDNPSDDTAVTVTSDGLVPTTYWTTLKGCSESAKQELIQKGGGVRVKFNLRSHDTTRDLRLPDEPDVP